MSDEQKKPIESAAFVALAEWESVFSAEVLVCAAKIANNARSETVTLEHYREAGEVAVEKLLATIRGELKTDVKREAA